MSKHTHFSGQPLQYNMGEVSAYNGFYHHQSVFKRLKGRRTQSKTREKKGGIKVRTVSRADEGPPYSLHYTSAATHDHVMLDKLKLSSGAFPAMNRAYIDYKVFEQFTQDGV